MITTADALQSLKPKAEWVLRGDELEWLDAVQTEPTQAEIDAEVIRLQAEYDSQDYARKRKAEYDQLNQKKLSRDSQQEQIETASNVLIANFQLIQDKLSLLLHEQRIPARFFDIYSILLHKQEWK